MKFQVFGSLFGIGLILAGLGLAMALPRHQELWRKLPRERVAGGIIGTACLVWSAMLVSPLLSDALPSLHSLLPILVIVLALVSIVFLEYLLTRALGGLILLSAVQGMAMAFNDHTPARWLFSIFCYALGIAAMFMIGSPWRFRDLLRKMAGDRRWRQVITSILMVIGLTTLILALATPS